MSAPPTWKPVPGPILAGANLQTADGSSGPQIANPSYLTNTVLVELQELQALGVKAVSVPVGYPVLNASFQGGASALKPYLTFYAGVANAVHQAGLKLIVDNEVLLSSSVNTAWPTLKAFYAGQNWAQYVAGRAAMAAQIVNTMHPDYLILAEEPDNEAFTTGQSNANNPLSAALMVQAEITSVLSLNLTNAPKLGAGFGSWTVGLTDFIANYVILPLDYIDIHIFPVNTEHGASLIGNALQIAQLAAAAGKPVALGQAWAWKMEDKEWTVLNGNDYRARDPFSFWAPLDSYFLQTMQSLAKYTEMEYWVPEGPNYLFAYQTYGGTAANGGAATCTCTVESGSCSAHSIIQTENQVAHSANLLSGYTTTGFSFYNQLVNYSVPAPTSPTTLTATPGYTEVTLNWNLSSDTIGVAGYNVYRCSPGAVGGSCNGVKIANDTMPPFTDYGVTSKTAYNYWVQAFNFSGMRSPLSPVLGTQTH